METKEIIAKAFQKCDLALNGKIISRENILQSLFTFLNDSSEKKAHNNGFVLHTGSICYDAIAVAFAFLTCLIKNTSNSIDIINNLRIGDFVLYARGNKQEKCKYNGKIYSDNEDAVKLIAGRKTEFTVPKSRWNLIFPYNGKSKRLDARGIKKIPPSRELFYTDILGIEKKEIPSIIDCSVVFVMDRNRATEIIKNLSFKTDNGNEFKILDMINAAYYSEDEDYSIGSNNTKSEANIKITSKVSVARQLVVNQDGNNHIGLIISGNDIVSKNITEIPEMLKKRSLSFVHTFLNIDSDNTLQLIRESQDPEIFACTKSFLSKTSLEICLENEYTQELISQANLVKNHSVNTHYLDGFLSWNDYKQFKKSIFFIKKSDYESEHKENFVLCAYSMMKLFLTAIFPLKKLEACIEKRLIDIESLKQRFDLLKSSILHFPDDLKTKAEEIISMLELLQESLLTKSDKCTCIINNLITSTNEKIAIVVPKAYYITVVRECGLYDTIKQKNTITVVTANKFDNSENYKQIIVVGNFGGKRFNIFKCMSSLQIDVLLYKFEEKLFKHWEKKNNLEEKEILLASAESLSSQPTSQIYDDEVNEIESIEKNVDDYINTLECKKLARDADIVNKSENFSQKSEIIAIGQFDNGEHAFFSKFYKAYVFDENNGKVKEVEANDLTEGDSIVFTRNSDKTCDIVDSVFENLKDNNKLGKDLITHWAFSIIWKSNFQNFMLSNNLTAKEIADKMLKNGIQVKEMTIRRWLDPYAHIVGPRDMESIQHIALVINHNEMFDIADKIFEGCQAIRKFRKELIKEIGIAMIDKLNGRTTPRNKLMEGFFDQLDTLTRVLRLEKITFVNTSVPINLINRPLHP